jgi:sterol desaturase/sphingolipid hydroxylase (fatty acid hydroxylase superfamily)
MDKLRSLLDIDLNYIIIALIFLFFTMEQVINGPFKFSKRPQHLFQNILFQVLFVAINFFYAGFQVYSINWLNQHEVGLLYLFQLPVWASLVLGVLLYDLTTYWMHRGAHRIPLLWRLHRVHHSDTTMDSSTYFRSHPFEGFLYYGIGNILTALVFGTDVLSMALYYFILTFFLFFEHSNLRYPSWLNHTLGWVFVMPDQHKVHHEQDQHYTDSNFSDIFILWDRIFGTYKFKPVDQITYGLKEFESEEKQTFFYLMKSPFIHIDRVSSEDLKDRQTPK